MGDYKIFYISLRDTSYKYPLIIIRRAYNKICRYNTYYNFTVNMHSRQNCRQMLTNRD